jgi:hypothetical protein
VRAIGKERSRERVLADTDCLQISQGIFVIPDNSRAYPAYLVSYQSSQSARPVRPVPASHKPGKTRANISLGKPDHARKRPRIQVPTPISHLKSPPQVQSNDNRHGGGGEHGSDAGDTSAASAEQNIDGKTGKAGPAPLLPNRLGGMTMISASEIIVIHSDDD